MRQRVLFLSVYGFGGAPLTIQNPFSKVTRDDRTTPLIGFYRRYRTVEKRAANVMPYRLNAPPHLLTITLDAIIDDRLCFD